MVLIMGWGDRHDVLGTTADRACERCLNTGPWVIYRSRKRLNVMFIPVARWGTRFAVRCTVCPNETELSALDAHRLARGDITLEELR
jgi:hypothetical protein